MPWPSAESHPGDSPAVAHVTVPPRRATCCGRSDHRFARRFDEHSILLSSSIDPRAASTSASRRSVRAQACAPRTRPLIGGRGSRGRGALVAGPAGKSVRRCATCHARTQEAKIARRSGPLHTPTQGRTVGRSSPACFEHLPTAPQARVWPLAAALLVVRQSSSRGGVTASRVKQQSRRLQRSVISEWRQTLSVGFREDDGATPRCRLRAAPGARGTGVDRSR